jgi:hypothetical protein
MATPLAQMPKDQLDKLFELYLANQATTTRFPIMSSAGVILLALYSRSDLCLRGVITVTRETF